MAKATLTQSRLKDLLNYDPETGIFTWRASGPKHRAGDIASGDHQGYVRFQIDGKKYRAHRLAWLWMTGAFPENGIDHRNGDKSDNRFTNLRAATQSENGQNRRRNKDNVSGFAGVSKNYRGEKWKAQICVNRKVIHLGLFETKEAAHAAYLKAKGEFHSFQPVLRYG